MEKLWSQIKAADKASKAVQIERQKLANVAHNLFLQFKTTRQLVENKNGMCYFQDPVAEAQCNHINSQICSLNEHSMQLLVQAHSKCATLVMKHKWSWGEIETEFRKRDMDIWLVAESFDPKMLLDQGFKVVDICTQEPRKYKITMHMMPYENYLTKLHQFWENKEDNLKALRNETGTMYPVV